MGLTILGLAQTFPLRIFFLYKIGFLNNLQTKDGALVHGMGVSLSRAHFDTCFGDKTVPVWYSLVEGRVRLIFFFD